MRCEVCGSELYESEKEFNDGMCWYCEEDEKEPDDVGAFFSLKTRITR